MSYCKHRGERTSNTVADYYLSAVEQSGINAKRHNLNMKYIDTEDSHHHDNILLLAG